MLCTKLPIGVRPLSAHTPFAPLRPRVLGRSRRVVAMVADSTVLIPIATGTEEMEAVIMIDVLRRAGAKVVVASTESGLVVTCSRGVKIVADQLIADCSSHCYDLIACPGGMPGAERLRDCAVLSDMVASQRAAGRLYAAICATPAVFFEAKGLLEGKAATAHPAFSGDLKDQSKVDERVVVDGNLTTSRGPGTAFEFSLALVKQLYDEEKAQAVAAPMVMYPFKV
ncbi:Chaperone protein YajL [Tetrabaena socialis]|uniref:Chaperone protein YajL n=1 Tax=Tetrabaena socialis TaxID=47790 RepID=A0A2J7ZZ32_9CHLO|nr:Chaperone protein YajL [Tetrabaena socialis]|eukprot:PNH05527.1 Chaperone protein YajL [Tetrabaena socialis]